MNRHDLLEKALRSSATIHQPHALKSFVAADNLYKSFDQNEAIWEQTGNLISKSEIWVVTEFASQVDAPEFSDSRIARILSGGIYPAAYQAMWQWYERKGIEDIFDFYLKCASESQESLSHNVTILLALKAVYGQLNESQIPLFLNRLTEFVTSTFYNPRNSSSADQSIEVSATELLRACLIQPDFFGHNLITLAWILRAKTLLSESQLSRMFQYLYDLATKPLDDPDDQLDQVILNSLEGSKKSFIEGINDLVFGQCVNLHQVTLADALVVLQNEFPDQTENLNRIAQYYVTWLKN